MRSIQYNNCICVTTPNYVYVKTIKNIKAGDELVTSYDACYWCKHLTTKQCVTHLNNYLSTLNDKQRKIIINIVTTQKHFVPIRSPKIQ